MLEMEAVMPPFSFHIKIMSNNDIFGNLGFSMSGTAMEVKKVTAERLADIISEVLKKRYSSEPLKQEIVGKTGATRLQISCPYCGDSRDAKKKRGNVYTTFGMFKCYNGGCDKYTSVLQMVKDFDCTHILKEGEEVSLKIQMSENQASNRVQTRIRSYEMNVDAMTGTDFSKVLISRSKLMTKLKLWEIYSNSPAGNYLKMRGQELDTRFAWDNWKKRIFIFNTDKTGEWIFSMQTTFLDKSLQRPGQKYLTYRCSEIWSKWLKEPIPEEVTLVDHLSQFFGVLRINFNAPITIFEGPLDHFIFPNSVATCGSNFEWPFQLDNDRYLQDNDEAGRNTASKALAEGSKIFMWKKFLQNYNITGPIKDWTDVVKWEMKNAKPVDVEPYFSDSPLDMIFV